ncbi:MAG: NAD-dependent protein deacylase [Bdellovibrionaceae bacterium]|nr:NAD-dependent protein deacylase [Pseudobdellovibrionaceae bacterium]|tara:strand:+ start:56006 stop:56725 length:720 start_codon:yes stop_codon:yes gene_type:complete
MNEKVVILTGAGISAESGLRTFRDQNGLWEDHSIEEVATYDAFIKNPELVHRFYNARRAQLISDEVSPNPAHAAIQRLFEALGPDRFFLVTQNVDDLHDRVGTPCVHMHGELLKGRCEACNSVFDLHDPLSTESVCFKCKEKGLLRPHIVWFGEIPFNMELIYSQLSESDLFISIGTSGLVYPAAQFVREAKNVGGARCIEFNTENTPISIEFDESIEGPAGETLPGWVDHFLKQRGLL